MSSLVHSPAVLLKAVREVLSLHTPQELDVSTSRRVPGALWSSSNG